jgi:hypothetical protein
MGVFFDKGSNCWRVTVQRKGSRINKRCKSREDAELMLAKIEAEFKTMTRRKALVLDTIGSSPDEVAAWEDAIRAAMVDEKSWFRLAYINLKRRHKKRGYDMSVITPEQLGAIYLACKGRCSVSGIRLKLQGNGKVSAQTASVDRINPDHGYIPDNCRIVAYCVNVAMSNWGEEFFRKVCYGIVAREYL